MRGRGGAPSIGDRNHPPAHSCAKRDYFLSCPPVAVVVVDVEG
jgi:hypothetical protein